jgi:hypothetical protein
MDPDLKPKDVEEMDLGRKCLAKDSRFINAEGYYSYKYPGMIFQKDDGTDYISKIRLTKDFQGNLPDGTLVNLRTLVLRDVLKIYPRLDSTWGSRGCSDYFNFSNDTVSFYVKIDTSRKPQFPIDKAYYLDKAIEGIDIIISCYNIFHKEETLVLFPPDEPMLFLDSIRVNMGTLKTYKPSEIAFISVYKDSNAIRIAGKEAKNGAVYIITNKFARDSYWNYFKSKSADYQKTVPDIETEAEIVYILNGKVLKSGMESELYSINDSNFIELTAITKKQLKTDWGVSAKYAGVIIKTAGKKLSQ